ncbi:peptidylprolyl isomerase [Nannochloropsis oceanica]
MVQEHCREDDHNDTDTDGMAMKLLCFTLLCCSVLPSMAYLMPFMKAPSCNPSSSGKNTIARRDAVAGTGMMAALILAVGGGTATAFGLPLGASAEEPVKVRKVNPNKIRETANGVKYFDVKVGEGASPREGNYVIITYIGQLSDGTIFDGLHGPGKKPLAFKLGAKQVIPGLEEALLGMQPGGERQCLVPAELAFGEKGVCTDKGECLVPPNSNVKYDVTLKRVAVSPI